MKKNFWKKTAAALLVLVAIAGTTPVLNSSQGPFSTAITASAAEQCVDTTSLESAYTAHDGDILTGFALKVIYIADGAKVTLRDAMFCKGIVCLGDATIILEGSNSTIGHAVGDLGTAGITCGGMGTTLTITGDGKLFAAGVRGSAGIGMDSADTAECGDIVIESGTINAVGGMLKDRHSGAGIGTCHMFNSETIYRMGDIALKGGNVEIHSVAECSGIGKGYIEEGAKYNVGEVKVYETIGRIATTGTIADMTYKHMDGENEIDVTANVEQYFEFSDEPIICRTETKTVIIPRGNGMEKGAETEV